MNDKLKQLWISVHAQQQVAAENGWGDDCWIEMNDRVLHAETIIQTLLYNCFGLPEPLLPPTEEEINGYIASKHYRRAA